MLSVKSVRASSSNFFILVLWLSSQRIRGRAKYRHSGNCIAQGLGSPKHCPVRGNLIHFVLFLLRSEIGFLWLESLDIMHRCCMCDSLNQGLSLFDNIQQQQQVWLFSFKPWCYSVHSCTIRQVVSLPTMAMFLSHAWYMEKPSLILVLVLYCSRQSCLQCMFTNYACVHHCWPCPRKTIKVFWNDLSVLPWGEEWEFSKEKDMIEREINLGEDNYEKRQQSRLSQCMKSEIFRMQQADSEIAFVSLIYDTILHQNVW